MGRAKILTGTCDCETDPFLYGREPVAFSWGLYIPGYKEEYWEWWGEDCTKDFLAFIEQLPSCKLYWHNGGKFDAFQIFQLLDMKHISHLNNNINVINGRVAEMFVNNVKFIDSFMQIPIPLGAYQKTEIDYEIFEEDVRDFHKKEILDYLKDDCVFLFELIEGFQSIAGKRLTIGACAFDKMKSLGIVPPKLGVHHDGAGSEGKGFRRFYYGGRCQAFQIGVWENAEFDYVDINSAYPALMAKHRFPSGPDYRTSTKLPKASILGPCFCDITAIAKGSLPIKAEDGSLTFPSDNEPRRYNVTGWEVKSGLKTKTLKILEIHEVLIPSDFIEFAPYVNKYYEERMIAKEAFKNGDKFAGIIELACKILLNSGYGKFATNALDFDEFKLAKMGVNLNKLEGFEIDESEFSDAEIEEWEAEIEASGEEKWRLHEDVNKRMSVWKRNTPDENGFYDVATAASITGAVRAYMWENILKCEGVVYCDTDSIICKKHNVTISKKLGDWGIEGTGKVTRLYVAGKKLYAAGFKDDSWKMAHKGFKCSPEDMKHIAEDENNIFIYEQPAPVYSISNFFTAKGESATGAGKLKRYISRRGDKALREIKEAHKNDKIAELQKLQMA